MKSTSSSFANSSVVRSGYLRYAVHELRNVLNSLELTIHLLKDNTEKTSNAELTTICSNIGHSNKPLHSIADGLFRMAHELHAWKADQFHVQRLRSFADRVVPGTIDFRVDQEYDSCLVWIDLVAFQAALKRMVEISPNERLLCCVTTDAIAGIDEKTLHFRVTTQMPLAEFHLLVCLWKALRGQVTTTQQTIDFALPLETKESHESSGRTL